MHKVRLRSGSTIPPTGWISVFLGVAITCNLNRPMIRRPAPWHGRMSEGSCRTTRLIILQSHFMVSPQAAACISVLKSCCVVVMLRECARLFDNERSEIESEAHRMLDNERTDVLNNERSEIACSSQTVVPCCGGGDKFCWKDPTSCEEKLERSGSSDSGGESLGSSSADTKVEFASAPTKTSCSGKG